jgi:hypothetical protein
MVIQSKDMDSYLQPGRGSGGHRARRPGLRRRRYRRRFGRPMVMRHFQLGCLTSPVLTLPIGVVPLALAALLVLAPGRQQAPAARLRRADR